MGCISSYLAVAATTPTVITTSSGYGYRTNLRRQQAERTSTANTATTASSRSSTSKPFTASAKNHYSAQSNSSQIFTISNKALANTSKNAPKTIVDASSSINKRLSSVNNPTASSAARQSTLNSQSSASASLISSVRSKTSKTSATKTSNSVFSKSSVLSKSFAKTNKVSSSQKQSGKWKSAQLATHTLTSTATPNTNSATSSTKSPPSTSSTSEVQSHVISKEPTSTEQDVISIDKLLGMRIDSAKLKKILDRKKSLTGSSIASEKSNVLMKNFINDHLQIDIANFEKGKFLSSNASTDASWEYAIDANHRLYKVLPDSNSKNEKLFIMPPKNESTQKSSIYNENNVEKEPNSNSTSQEQKSLHRSQRSILSHGSATSYPMSQFSRSTMSSVSSHPNKQAFLRQQESFETHKEIAKNRFLELIKPLNLRQYQSESMNNQFIPSTATSTDSSKLKRLHHLNVVEHTQSEHEAFKLELVSQATSFDSELQRKYSEVSQNFKTKPSSENIHLPLLTAQRRQSDLSNVRNHRPSLADRQRKLRKTQTLPNLVFDEDDVLSNESSGYPFANHLKSSDVHICHDEIKSDVEIEINQTRLNTPKETYFRPVTSTVYSTASSHMDLVSHSDLRSKAFNSKTRRQMSKSPSLVSSKMSNRFESLLRHRSFLQTAASTVSSLGSHSRRGSEFSTFAGTTHKAMQIMSDHSSGVNCLELSEDRSLLVSGGEDGILRLWSTFSSPCECIGILIGHKGYITCCAVYRLMVISGSADRTIKLWSIEDGNCLMTLSGHTAFINRIACYGPLLLSTSFDGTARIWTLAERITLINNLKQENGSIEVADDLDEIVEESQDEFLQLKLKGKTNVNLVHRQTVKTMFGGCLHILKGHERSVTQIAMVATDMSLLESGIIQELDIVVSTSADGSARTWSLATGEQRHVLTGHNGPVNCMALDPKETQYVYTAGADWVIKCWDVVTGEHLRDLKGHQNAVLCLLSHNRILYSGSADNTVRAWAMEFGQCTRIYYRNTSAITCIQYFNGVVYTGSNDHSARLYDSNSGVLKQTFTGHQNAISALKVVSGKVFTASFDGKILVWNCDEVQKEIEAAGSSLNAPNVNNQNISQNSRSNSQSLQRRHSKTGKSKHAFQNQQSAIGASIVNHTLTLFPVGFTNREQHSREVLYPQLRKKSSNDLPVNGVIERVLTGKKKKIRQSVNRRKSSTSSSIKSSSCFGSKIWPDRIRSLSSSLTSLAKSSNCCWSNRTGRHFIKKTKVRRMRPHDTTRDPIATVNECRQQKLSHSIRALIESTGDSHYKSANLNQNSTNENGIAPDDSANVQRAIDALEPYLRSFK